MEARRKRGEVKSENGGRAPRRSTSETRDEERERATDERERERARRTRVRLARACPNIGDTHEAKRVRPEASTERGQTPLDGEERE